MLVIDHIPIIPFVRTWARYVSLPTNALVTKDAATQRGAMRKSDTCACNPARHKPIRRGPATGPVALCTSPYISTPSPPHDRPLRPHTLDVRNERRLVQWVARPNMRGTGVPVRLLPSPDKSSYRHVGNPNSHIPRRPRLSRLGKFSPRGISGWGDC